MRYRNRTYKNYNTTRETVVNDDTILSSNIIPENIKQEISEEVSEELIKENKLSDSKKQKNKATPVIETHI